MFNKTLVRVGSLYGCVCSCYCIADSLTRATREVTASDQCLDNFLFNPRKGVTTTIAVTNDNNDDDNNNNLFI